MILALESTIILWAVTAELVAAFQCHLPNPWQFVGNSCIDTVSSELVEHSSMGSDGTQKSFWNYFGILNILTDAAVVLLPAIIVWRLQMNQKRKTVIISCFAARVL